MPLVLAGVGQKCIIEDFTCASDLRMRMVNMGFVPGCSIEIMNRMNGTLLVKVGQARIMLEKCVANQIRVC